MFSCFQFMDLVLNGCFGCSPHDKLPFCDKTLSVHERVLDLVKRVNDSDKPNLLTARGLGGGGSKMQVRFGSRLGSLC